MRLENGKNFNFSQDQVTRINCHLADVGAMIGCLCMATPNIRELGIKFDLEHYAGMLENKFSNLAGEFNEANDQTIEAQKHKVCKIVAQPLAQDSAKAKNSETETFKSLEATALVAQPAAKELGSYAPPNASVKVNLIAMWEHLEHLMNLSEDSGQVHEWIEKIYTELKQCQVI